MARKLLAIESFVNLDDVTGLHVPELSEPIIDGLLRRGHVMMLTGPPKAGKSWCMVQLAYAIATGRSWMGFKCHQGTVAYVDTELDPNSLFNRFDKVREKMNLLNSCGNVKVLSLRGQANTLEDVVDGVELAFGKNPPALVIIDSIYTLESGDENSAGDMRGMLQSVGRLASLGCAVAFAHHHAKGNAGSKNVIDRGSGSGVFGRFVDAMVDLTPVVPDDDQKSMLDADYDGATAMRMSFVLREFADPGNRTVVFDFPVLRDITGGYMDDAPEDGSQRASAMKARSAKSEKSKSDWAIKDDAIGIAVHRCIVDGVSKTRANVLERIEWPDMTRGKLYSWTRKDAKSHWRVDEKTDELYRID